MGDEVLDNLTVNLLTKLKGNVGIGTGEPGTRLEVNGPYVEGKGTVYIKGVGDHGILVIDTDSKKKESGILWQKEGSKKWHCHIMGDSDDLRFWEKIERVTFQAGGNVGIGTTSPSAMLEVNGDIKATGDIRINDKNLWLRGGTDTNHGIGWYGQGKLFAGMNLDGPAVFGFSGGALGTTKNGQKIALQWNGDGKGNVLINGILDCGGPIRTGDVEANGNIKVKGDVILTGADCAEDFYVAGAESVDPGTVMVIEREGALRPSDQAYDKRVAGVISGAGDLRPGITLDRQNNKTNRLPLALNGKVYCKIDAQYGSVELGDLLTTSPTYGHAMKADDPFKAFGSVIGKALRPMETGRGIIPILVALQ